MVTPTDKARREKKQRKIFIIMGSIGYTFAVLTFLQFNALRLTDKRTNISDAINIAMLNIILKPLDIFKLDPMMFLYVILGTVMGVIVLVITSSERALKKHDNPETVNGEAHFMNLEEMATYNTKRTDPLGKTTSDGPNNMILSRDIKLAIDGNHTRRNCNVLVIGGSGAGKSRFFAAPNILQYNANFVITDPSGEMLNDYGKALEDNGYTVKVFNLSDVYRGNRYNPFHYVKEEKDVFILVNTLIKNTTPPDGHGGDPFWENSEKVLLSALILYLWHVYPAEQQTFSNVVKLVNMAEVDENDASAESPLDVLFADLEREDPENLAVKQYKTFKLGAGKTLKSILISVGVRLESFKLSDIQYLTSTDEFEFEKFADSKQALFVIIPTADTTFNFIVSLLYSQLFSSLYTYVETRSFFGWEAYINKLTIVKVEQSYTQEGSKDAKKKIENFVNEIKQGVYAKYDNERKLYKIYTRKSNTLVAWRGTKEKAQTYMDALKDIKIQPCPRKCPNHVRLILDEFANIGQIPDFDQKLATIRKYEISCSIILQAISQLKDLYEKKWNTIAANCDSKLFLGCDDPDTIEWLLKLLGKKTTTVENTSWQANGNGSTSYNKSSLELITMDQVTMMADDECLVRIRGERPYYGKKYELTNHPNYKYAHEKEGTFNIPSSVSDGHVRLSGPLRDRKKSAGAVAAASTAEKPKNPVQKTSDSSVHEKPATVAPHSTAQNPSNPNQSILKARNYSRKQEAMEAREALAQMEEQQQIVITEDMISEGLARNFNVTPEMPDEQIIESVESQIILEDPPSDSFVFAMTD